jgi:hypothetical protein
LPEGARHPISNDDLGVTTIWIVMLSAVAYLVVRAPARR